MTVRSAATHGRAVVEVVLDRPQAHTALDATLNAMQAFEAASPEGARVIAIRSESRSDAAFGEPEAVDGQLLLPALRGGAYDQFAAGRRKEQG